MSAPPIRVFVVDDSVVVRRVLARALDADPDFELAGSAGDGRAALAKITLTRPDAIVLDLEMPEMDGFETLRRLRDSDIPIVVFSHLSAVGAVAALDALALGATDFVLKPTSAKGLGLAESYVDMKLLPMLRAIARPQERLATVRTTPSPTVAGAARIDAVVITVSTGGPNALARLVADLPSTFPAPIFIVQHMPPMFTTQLAERLDRIHTISVKEATDGERVEAGRVYLAPGGRHMAVARHTGFVRVVLNDAAPENSCRPAGDVLFRSAAAVYGPGLLALVMTGMGCDGLRGAEAVRAAGGIVLAQDSATSVVDGMPRAVAAIAAASIPLPKLGAELCRLVIG